jgi:hypothetical protein
VLVAAEAAEAELVVLEVLVAVVLTLQPAQAISNKGRMALTVLFTLFMHLPMRQRPIRLAEQLKSGEIVQVIGLTG